jgi:hypothetical protein
MAAMARLERHLEVAAVDLVYLLLAGVDQLQMAALVHLGVVELVLTAMADILVELVVTVLF